MRSLQRLPSHPALLAAVAAIGLAGCASTPRDQPISQVPTYQIPDSRQQPTTDYRRRANETLYEAPVTSVRAVMGPNSGQRCWIEREQVDSRRNVPGAIVGGVIGGVLGHQIGGGTGRDIATVGGAVAGAAVGSNVGRNNTQYQDVQKCTTVGTNAPEYWDVSYTFRGVQHHVQLASPPGQSILVNENGEPRI